MPSKITNRAGVDLRIGPYFLPIGASFLVGDIGTSLAASIARGHVSQVVMPEGSYSITNNARTTTYVGGIHLEPGQTTVFDTLPDNADSAFLNGTLTYTFIPAMGTVGGGGSGSPSVDVTATFVASANGTQFIPYELTTGQLASGFTLTVNGLLQRGDYYSCSNSGIQITSTLDVVVGDLIDLNYSTAGTSIEASAPYTAPSTGAFFLSSTFTPLQISSGTELYVNGLRQRPDNFQVTSTGISVSAAANAVVGDLIDLQYSL